MPESAAPWLLRQVRYWLFFSVLPGVGEDGETGAVNGQVLVEQALDSKLTGLAERFNGCGPTAPCAKRSPSLLPVPVRVQLVQSE